MSSIILKDESYKIVGICMEVHRENSEIIILLIVARSNLKLNTKAILFLLDILLTS